MLRGCFKSIDFNRYMVKLLNYFAALIAKWFYCSATLIVLLLNGCARR